MGGSGGRVELVECKICGVSCMLLSRNMKGGGGGRSEKMAGAGVGGKVVVALKMDMHCDKCAGMVRSTVRQFSGVEEVKENGGLMELIVVGKVDPEQLRAKVEEKTKTKVSVISVSPATTNGDESTAGCGKTGMVVLRTLLYCESCVRKCKKVVHSHEGVQDVIIEKERGMTYVITVTGTMDVDRLLHRTESKLGRKVEAFTPPPKPAQPPSTQALTPPPKPAQPPSIQQAKETDHAKKGDGKAEGIAKAEAADRKATIKKSPAAAASAAKALVKKTKKDGLDLHVDNMQPPQQCSDNNPCACSVM